MAINKTTRIAIIGCGTWANYQVPAWLELEGVEIVALYNRTLKKARDLGTKYNILACYDNAEKMLQEVKPDLVDIITDVETHDQFITIAAQAGIPVICQKPMAPALTTAKKMIDKCNISAVPFFIHENFRWQAPIRKLKQIIESGIIGSPFKARVSFCSGLPAMKKQKFSKSPKFILTDAGSHILDICRFLFGEVNTLHCHTHKINPAVKGEDVANLLLKMQSGLHCFVEMSYASILEKKTFPQTLVAVEGEAGSIILDYDFELRVTTAGGTSTISSPPHDYQWADRDHLILHSSIVDCNRNILSALNGGQAETTAADNFETVKLVWAAYESATEETVIHMDGFNHRVKTL